MLQVSTGQSVTSSTRRTVLQATALLQVGTSLQARLVTTTRTSLQAVQTSTRLRFTTSVVLPIHSAQLLHLLLPQLLVLISALRCIRIRLVPLRLLTLTLHCMVISHTGLHAVSTVCQSRRSSQLCLRRHL